MSGKGKKKGKKKGSGKLANMNEEERLIYLQQQQQAEEEMKRKQEEMLSMYLKDKLAKEQKASQLNLYKLNHQWRNILRELKSRELKKDIEILSQTFERVVDRKDSVLKSLISDLEEAEEQYMMAIRAHIEIMDDLTKMQNERTTKLKSDYHAELDGLKSEFDTEEAKIIEEHRVTFDELKDIIVAFDKHYTQKDSDAKSEFQNLHDEIKTKIQDEKHNLRVTLEAKVNDLWAQFMLALKNYNETTDDRKKHFDALKKKDEKSARDIETQMRRLQRISDQIALLRGRMGTLTREYDEKNNRLREERERLVHQFQDMKSQMNRVFDQEREKLTRMTLESREADKTMQRLTDKAEQIVRLGEMCRKLETEEEKVLPFYASSLTAEEQEDVQAAMSEPANEELAKAMQHYAGLDRFWRRYNKVALEKLALDKEQHTLQEENAMLRTLLKQYLDGISVNDEVINQNNPLFVVNYRSNVDLSKNAEDPRVRPAPNVHLEAAHIAKYNVTSGLFK